MAPREHKLCAKILDRNGRIYGSGFLINPITVLTCYHVIDEIDKSELIYVGLPFIFNGSVQCKVSKIIDGVDVAILTLPEPLDHIQNFIPFVESGYSNLEGVECAVYINHGDEDYGWTSAVVGKHTHDYLIQANQIDNSRSVDHGHSGSPVWLKKGKGILGMVKSADGQGVFSFITAIELKSHLTDYSASKFKPKLEPTLPSNYVRRAKYFDTCLSILTDYDITKNSLLIVYGLSGVGKTKLAIDIYYSYPRTTRWVNINLVDKYETFSRYLKDLGKGDLLIVDGVNMFHPFVTDQWLKKSGLKSNVLITTANTDGLRHIRNSTATINRKISQYELSGLSEEESIHFLSDISDDVINTNSKKKIAETTKGLPILLQLIKDIIDEDISKKTEEDFNFFNERNDFLGKILNTSLDKDRINHVIIEAWFSYAHIDKIHKEILFTLSCITCVGMSGSSILHVLETDQVQLNSSLQDLHRKGFISIQTNPNVKDEKIICVHDLIQELVVNADFFERAKYEKRFIHYVKNAKNEQGIMCSLISRIDALIVQMKTLWEKANSQEINPTDFLKGLEEYSNQLNLLLPQNSGSKHKSEWIAELFRPIVSKQCTIVIPLARSIARLEKNELLAEMIWQGLDNIYHDEYDDFLARACCIVSAFAHWVNLEGVDKDRIIRRTELHLDQVYLLLPETATDLEVAALLGGVSAIGFEEKALEVLESDKFKNRFGTNCFSYLVIIASLATKNHSMKSVHGRTFEEFVKDKLKLTAESEAKEDVIDFLGKNGFKISKNAVKSNQDFYKNANGMQMEGLSRTVALMAHSQNFDDYVIVKRGYNSWV